MKKGFVIVLLLTVVLFSCRKRTEAPVLKSVLVGSEWRVNKFNIAGTDYALLYRGMKFVFNADSSMKITDGTATYDGKWEADESARTFTMLIKSTRYEFTLMSTEWDIYLKTPNQVQFQDDLYSPNQQLWFGKW